jgi:hypothetical protein
MISKNSFYLFQKVCKSLISGSILIQKAKSANTCQYFVSKFIRKDTKNKDLIDADLKFAVTSL